MHPGFTWNCTSNFAGRGPSVLLHTSEAKEQIFPYTEGISKTVPTTLDMMQHKPFLCTAWWAGRIGLGCEYLQSMLMDRLEVWSVSKQHTMIPFFVHSLCKSDEWGDELLLIGVKSA